MRKCLLALIILAVAVGLWRRNRLARAAVAESAHQLRMELAGVQEELSMVQQRLAEQTQAEAAQGEEMLAARAAFAAAAAIEKATPPPLCPRTEGAWPAQRPYFYLAKEHLAEARYKLLTKEESISATTALLFGLTPSECSTLESAWRKLRADIALAQLAVAEAVPPRPGNDTENQRERAFRFPPLTNEFAAARSALLEGWRQVLGEERMELVTPALELQMAEISQQNGRELVVRLTARRQADGTVNHQLEFVRFQDGKVVGSTAKVLSFPTQPGSPLWEYGHLLGTEPLIAAP